MEITVSLLIKGWWVEFRDFHKSYKPYTTTEYNMVEIEQTVSIYRSYKGTFEEEIKELNNALSEIGIDCEVISIPSDDGETLLFKKRE